MNSPSGRTSRRASLQAKAWPTASSKPSTWPCVATQNTRGLAAARVQAAQVGNALGDYLLSLDGKVTANRVHVNGGQSTNQRNAALTLSWLLYDFGARSASLENARQFLAAASHSLDATVQSVFLAAMQGYYNAQAARAVVQAALESEKPARKAWSLQKHVTAWAAPPRLTGYRRKPQDRKPHSPGFAPKACKNNPRHASQPDRQRCRHSLASG